MNHHEFPLNTCENNHTFQSKFLTDDNNGGMLVCDESVHNTYVSVKE